MTAKIFEVISGNFMETERVKPFVSFVKKQRGAGFKKIPANWADFLQKPDWAMEGAAYSKSVADVTADEHESIRKISGHGKNQKPAQ